MNKQIQINSCQRCNEPVNGNYCSNCGLPAKLKRIDNHHIICEIRDILFTNKGFLYTVKRLLASPGNSVRHYISADRSKFVNPITFVVIASLIYTLVSHFFNIGVEAYSFQESETESPTLNLFLNWIIDNHGYASIIIGFLMAFWVKLFFRKSGHNLAEIFVLICFSSGMSSLIFSVALTFQGLMHLNLVHIAAIIAMVYYVWVAGQFFNKRKASSYIKAFCSYMFGVATFSILITLIGIFIDMIIK